MSGEEIPAHCLGETGALSFKKPTEQDHKDTQELEATLSQLNIFETSEEVSQRRESLVRLQEISNTWIRDKALEQNLPTHVANSTTGKIFTFGSYRLGVNFRGADIDSLLVVPRFITREEFFGEFQTVLSENSNVEDLHAVTDAFVPVLKMKFMGVEIDLIFAQVDQMSIPENFNLCENTEVLMRNMDERDVRSINGVRVTEDILNLVFNKNAFKVALKVIRIWAKHRNIYSNSLGFFGGVSWAILVSRICQLYPYATPSMIVYLFFTIFSQWPWPKPVRLRESEYIPSVCLPVWDPRLNPPDQYHLMPILTPSYPSQNSTYNVQRSNRIIIERELKQGLNIVRQSLMHKRTWSDLFGSAFFFRYRHYVVVIVIGDIKHAFIELCGLVESRLRVLVSNFELNRYVKMAHVNCHAYGKGPNDEDANFVRKWFIGMEFDRNPNSLSTNHSNAGEKPTLNVDLSENISSFEKSIERGLSHENLSVAVKYVKKSQLTQFIAVEEMEEIKNQAAASALVDAQNNPVESPKTPNRRSVNAKTSKPMSSKSTNSNSTELEKSTSSVDHDNSTSLNFADHDNSKNLNPSDDDNLKKLNSPDHNDSTNLSSISCVSLVDVKLINSPNQSSLTDQNCASPVSCATNSVHYTKILNDVSESVQTDQPPHLLESETNLSPVQNQKIKISNELDESSSKHLASKRPHLIEPILDSSDSPEVPINNVQTENYTTEDYIKRARIGTVIEPTSAQ